MGIGGTENNCTSYESLEASLGSNEGPKLLAQSTSTFYILAAAMSGDLNFMAKILSIARGFSRNDLPKLLAQHPRLPLHFLFYILHFTFW